MTTSAERIVGRVMAAAGPDPEDDDIGELEIAEYVVFLLALDTYSRYVEEHSGEGMEDALIHHGLQLVRIADRRHLETIRAFLDTSVPTPGQKKLIDKAFKFLPSNAASLSRRTFNVRTVFSRSGPTTMRAVFKTNKALQEIKAAMAAALTDDADEALDKFAVIHMKNPRLRKWIDQAAASAGSGAVQNPIAASSSGTSDDAEKLLVSRTQQQAASPTSDDNRAELDNKEDLLQQVQQTAVDAAQRAMAVSGERDEPPVKSEVIGIATAAAVAAVTDPSISSNVPEPLRKLDDEQRAAALTDGRVLVAAGAGAGKSTTVVSRVEYLVKDRRVLPSRILVTSFNTKAANELKQKIGSAIGADGLNQMSVGTMHSLFRKFIGEYGTPPERSAMGVGKDRGGFVQGGGAVARAVQRLWSECYPADSDRERKVPKLKNVLMAKSKWSGNSVSPTDAKAQAHTQDDIDAADWYEMYEGLKGSLPGWKPPCGTSKGYESFMAKWRPSNQRLGDFDDMLGIFDTILKREPMVRKTLQGMFDHLIVDEAQDLSGVQFSIISQMAEHITDGKDGKSLWICGDDKQSIYGFRGARPDLFTQLNTTPGWTTKMIRTNYRCQPEIVDCANHLIAFNEKQIPMEAVPSGAKVRGVGSVRVNTSSDEADAALDVVEEIKANVGAGEDVANNAILTRTNKEQHAFETACIIRGVPYARKGASSFLGSPETKAFLSYVQLVTGDDFAKMQSALGEVINKPNRFFIAPDAGVAAVQDAISAYARHSGQDLKSVSPMAALSDRFFVSVLAEKLTRVRAGFKFDKALEKISDIRSAIEDMRASASDPRFTTKDLFDGILGMTGTVAVTDRSGRTTYVEQTFRDSLKADLRDSVSEDDDTESEEDDTEGLGNVSFLYELAKKDPTDPEDLITDPNTPFGFKAKMERYAARARDLRIDLTKWDKEQAALPPEQRKAPPGVYLGTVHSVKGAQWRNCYVSMPKGKFPFTPPQKPGQPPPPPEVEQEEMESERRLGYVALTRAAMNLTIVCPSSVGGRPAGVSPFVAEARLKLGENVQKPGAPTPSSEPTDPVKTATEYEGILPEEWHDPATPSYDRRQS